MSDSLIKNNNAAFGMTIQKVICDLYGVVPHKNAIEQFENVYDRELAKIVRPIIRNIFDEIELRPVQCLTMAPSKSAKETFSPHNFVLEDGSTLSIRTNVSGDKVAPRVVGQCGIEKFNEHFAGIAGYEIVDKHQIKDVIFNNIHLMLPIFADYLFASDYTVWVFFQGDTPKYEIIESSKILDIDLKRSLFTFTRNPDKWNESTTLKYNGKSLAEIQVHKNRSFKFRFIMGTLLQLLQEQKTTSETLGITAEKAICDLFGLECPPSFQRRASKKLEEELMPTVGEAFLRLPKATKHTGSLPGESGGESKCPYDFLLEGDKKLSLKTNTGKMVCPPEVGQPGAETCYFHFHDLIDEDHIDGPIFKKMVLEKIDQLIPIYLQHLFDSDYLLWIYRVESKFEYAVFTQGFGRDVLWKKEAFSFTKETVEDWNESNTVKYKGVSIGEFQVHKGRDCYKFRFNLVNLVSVIMESGC